MMMATPYLRIIFFFKLGWWDEGYAKVQVLVLTLIPTQHICPSMTPV